MNPPAISLAAATLVAAAVAHAGSIVLPTTIDGDTCGADDTCEYFFPDSPDVHYEVDVIRSVSRTFHMCGSAAWDSIIAVGTGTCGAEAGIGDNLCVLYGGGGHGILRLSNLDPGTYSITIDGFNVGACGEYTLQAYCSADVDRNGQIAFADLLDILGAWGTVCDLCPEDVNLDRTVDFADLLVVLSDYGACE